MTFQVISSPSFAGQDAIQKMNETDKPASLNFIEEIIEEHLVIGKNIGWYSPEPYRYFQFPMLY